MGKTRLRLRALRGQQEPPLSQVLVARQAGMHKLRYHRIEKGEIDPTTEEKNAVAAVFGVKVSDIQWPAREAAHAS
jgi:DNA-binding XRE family transcriptional regulator